MHRSFALFASLGNFWISIKFSPEMGTNSNKLVFGMALVVIVVALLLFVCSVEGGRGKILANFPFVELGDFRFGGEPYLIFYERENYRGQSNNKLGMAYQKLNAFVL